jgi:hypothetical protein
LYFSTCAGFSLALLFERKIMVRKAMETMARRDKR